MLIALGVLTGVPALALLAVAARVGSRPHERRIGLLATLGATRRDRAVVTMGEAALPAAAGTALAVLPMLAAMTTDLRIPPTGYLLNSSDLRAVWPMSVAALILSFTLTVATVVLLHRAARHHSATQAQLSVSGAPRWRTVGCGLGVAAVAFSQYLMGQAALLVFAGGTVVMWALLPSAATAAVRVLGDKLAARGFRAGRAGQLIGGRWTVAHPGVVVRPAVALCIGLGLVCQLQIGNSHLGDKAAAARATEARVQDSVLSVQSRDLTPSLIEEFTRSLPAGSRVLALNTDVDQQGALLQGTCRTWRSLSLPCPTRPVTVTGDDDRMTEIGHWYGPHLRMQVASSPPHLDRLRGSLVVITSGPGRRAQVERAAYALVPTVNVETLGETWLVGAGNKARLNNWVVLFGATGLALLLLAGGLSAAAEFVRARRPLAPLVALTGSHQVYRSAALWHLTVPLLISTVVAAVVTAWHAGFLTAVVGNGGFSWDLLATAMCAGALLAVAAGILGGRVPSGAAQRGPSADD
ncbi:hypothetical protein [Streptomyces chattanoogensis]|uniref:hypothetical protein n=1 Tax=Streptomyces chattanoogensis TaxID=66876 RepID=UPI0006B55D4C|nr:hypothetical protein [Streptomyces chattanoogensis]